MARFLELNDMSNVIKTKTCFKSEKGTCIDLILTNSKNLSKNSGTVETGLSDFHRLIYAVLKTKYTKLSPKIIKYRDYKNFNKNNFLYELEYCISSNIFENYDQFENVFHNIVNRHAPLKTKFLRANNKPHVTKDLRKAIMIRSHLKAVAIKSKQPEDKAIYNRQRNLVVQLNKKAKKLFFSKNNQNSKHFWDAIKTKFSDKNCKAEGKIQLLENDVLHTSDEHVANIFNTYFNRITETLEIPSWSNQSTSLNSDDTSELTFQNHPSIKEINRNRNSDQIFDFTKVEETEVLKVILSLNNSKSVSGTIPTRMLKIAANTCVPFLTTCFNNCVESGTFPDRLKLADIIPSFKKGCLTDKANYRPISLLPVVSKIFERLIVNQLNVHFEPQFSKLLCGFRKGHSTQHAILNMIRQWQSAIANNLKVGAVLIDLSKAFDCLPHNLLLAKLSAYGLSESAVRLMHSYLSNRKHRVRVGSHLSSWLDILLGVPQGSILGPLLFNIFINDLFYIIKEISNFADDNTLSSSGPSIDDVNLKLLRQLRIVLDWFKHNSMVANPSKFQLIYPGTFNTNLSLPIEKNNIKSVDVVKLLGIKIDSRLSFIPHITELCKKSNQKLR
uniref:Reverse transcriptase domain-containing protein n=1 Tax=Clytia hemisphaerica TaxID=252671 RepID=A0A7M5X3F0_9CNID